MYLVGLGVAFSTPLNNSRLLFPSYFPLTYYYKQPQSQHEHQLVPAKMDLQVRRGVCIVLPSHQAEGKACGGGGHSLAVISIKQRENDLHWQFPLLDGRALLPVEVIFPLLGGKGFRSPVKGHMCISRSRPLLSLLGSYNKK